MLPTGRMTAIFLVRQLLQRYFSYIRAMVFLEYNAG